MAGISCLAPELGRCVTAYEEAVASSVHADIHLMFVDSGVPETEPMCVWSSSRPSMNAPLGDDMSRGLVAHGQQDRNGCPARLLDEALGFETQTGALFHTSMKSSVA